MARRPESPPHPSGTDRWNVTVACDRLATAVLALHESAFAGRRGNADAAKAIARGTQRECGEGAAPP